MEKINFKNIFIEDVKFGQGDDGVACGFIEGTLTASVKFIDGSKNTFYLMLDEVTGIPCFMLLEDDIFDKWVNGSYSDEEVEKIIKKYEISKFGEIDLQDSYENIFNSIYKRKLDKKEDGKLLRYIMSVMRCETSELDSYIKLGKNKYIKDIDIEPTKDEQEWLEDVYF